MKMGGRTGWAILDRGQLYINRLWATQIEAQRERDELLRHFAADHEWRDRLSVRYVEKGKIL